MATELKEVSTLKIHPEVHAMLKADAMVNGIEMNALCRDILYKWASRKHEINVKADELAKANGSTGVTGDWR